MKLCLIYNSAPLYREAIFRAIDAEYDCDWYFGRSKSDIKQMDTTVLHNVKYYNIIGDTNRFFLKVGVLKLLFKREYQQFLMLAATRSITDWLFFLLASVFFRKKRIYIWTHGWYGKEHGFDAKMKLWLYKHVAGTFLYGNYARGLLVKEGIPPEKLYTIHNSLHHDQQITLRESMKLSNVYGDHFGNNNPVIIFIGRLTKVKQLDMLVLALSELKAQNHFYNLVFVGDGEMRERLQNQVQRLELNNQVWFYGACFDEKKNAELIYNADLCVAPGNVGLTAMHTMVFGTPVISHNEFKWQMPEFEAIHPGETGDFFEYQNVKSLSETIRKWFFNKQDKREEVRQSCFKEIDTQWTPKFQMEVLKKNLK